MISRALLLAVALSACAVDVGETEDLLITCPPGTAPIGRACPRTCDVPGLCDDFCAGRQAGAACWLCDVAGHCGPDVGGAVICVPNAPGPIHCRHCSGLLGAFQCATWRACSIDYCGNALCHHEHAPDGEACAGGVCAAGVCQ